MAHVRILREPNIHIRVCYFTDSVVGLARANHREDVLLVQFFLRAMAQQTDPAIHQLVGVPGAPPLAVDGICGRNTVAAIKRFQLFTLAENKVNSSSIDGLIDVSPPGRPVTTITKNTYTIILLNVNFGVYFGPDSHAALFKEPGFPGELLYKFFA